MKKLQQTTDRLRRKIRAGEWEAGSQLPPRSHLSKVLGVSSGTVSAALQGLQREGLVHVVSSRGVYVAERVPAEDGSESPAVTRPTIGLVGSYVPSSDDLEAEGVEAVIQRQIFDGVWSMACREHCPVLFLPRDSSGGRRLSRAYCESLGVEGLIFLGGERHDEALALHCEGFPVMLANKPARPTPMIFADYDHVYLVREMVRTFTEFGHERIGVLHPEPTTPGYFDELKKDFIFALHCEGVPKSTDLTGRWVSVPWSDFHSDPGGTLAPIADRLLEEGTTAFFVWSSNMVFALREHLAGLGLRVPEDVSLMGGRRSHEPYNRVTGFERPAQALGQSLLRELFEKIRNPHHAAQHLLRPRYVEAGTVGPAPQSPPSISANPNE